MSLAVFNGTAVVLSGTTLIVSPFAQIEVKRETDGALASIYSDREGTAGLSNPMTADASGRYTFYASGLEQGYRIRVIEAASPGTEFTLRNQGSWVFAGRQTVWVPAGAMTSRTTNGAAAGSSELSTNKIMRRSMDFDQATIEYAQFQIKMPKGWNESSVGARFIWTVTPSSPQASGGVVWAIQGVVHSDDDALDAAFGTAQTVTDTALSENDCHITAETAAVTLAGTPAEGDFATFQVYRETTNVSDTMGEDALLLGVELYVTFDALTDN